MRISSKGLDSNVSHVDYDPDTQTLTVQFRPKGLYRYSGPNRTGGQSLGELFGEMGRKQDVKGWNLSGFVARNIARRGNPPFKFELVPEEGDL